MSPIQGLVLPIHPGSLNEQLDDRILISNDVPFLLAMVLFAFGLDDELLLLVEELELLFEFAVLVLVVPVAFFLAFHVDQVEGGGEVQGVAFVVLEPLPELLLLLHKSLVLLLLFSDFLLLLIKDGDTVEVLFNGGGGLVVDDEMGALGLQGGRVRGVQPRRVHLLQQVLLLRDRPHQRRVLVFGELGGGPKVGVAL